MIKKTYCFLSLLPLLSVAQVGINTTTPQGILHIDGKKDTPAVSPAALQPDDFIVKADGKVGVGTISPEVNLDVTAKTPTGTSTTPDGLLIPKVSLTRLQQIDDNVNLKYGTLLYVNDATGVRDTTTSYVVFPGFYFWNNTYWAKVLTFDANHGVNADVNIYQGASASIAKTVKCGRFEFAVQSSATPYIYARLNFNPGGSVTINPALQNEDADAGYKYTSSAVTYTSTNYAQFQQFNNYQILDRNMITMYVTYPGDTNFYRVEAFRITEASGANTWTLVCSQF